MFSKLWAASAAVVISMAVLAPAAAACGFLVAANGAVRLVRTSTFVAWDGEVERYITNFEFASAEKSFGSIIPLPGEPTDVRKAGQWTLQRLDREVRPEDPDGDGAVTTAAGESAASGVEVLLETRIDSLDITVVRGGGSEVAAWAADNGFSLGEEAGGLLDFYSDRSPYFLAARFDAPAAEADGFTSGDGIPILVEMPTERPWVPLHILGFEKPAAEIVEADVFLLTPDRPELVHGVGLTVNRSERANGRLLDDLRADENMGWVPINAWFTHMELSVPVADLSYDLSVGADGTAPSLLEAGLTRFDLSADDLAGFGFTVDEGAPSWWLLGATAVALGLVGGAAGAWAVTRQQARST